ncbi:MAG: hypothetical protein M1484_00320 [Patescibacteria group bacterium]|nr:hypothetical protein [Patescibacteria group bacterium]MCL5431525.1 hypothetical protein [Patescibacteria group bacterium]
MKRILLSLVMILAAATMVAGATRAYYTDSVTLSGITFSTGNADLKLTQIITHQWWDGTVSYTTPADSGWTTYASGQFSETNWYPGQTVTDGFYVGNFSTAQIGLTPTVSLTGYSQSVGGMDNVFLMRIHGTGYDSGWQTINWWRNNSFTMPNIAWVAGTPPNPNGSYSGYIDVQMDPSAGNSYQSAAMSFNLLFNAAQTP